jgi:hypothetical protein
MSLLLLVGESLAGGHAAFQTPVLLKDCAIETRVIESEAQSTIAWESENDAIEH